MQISDTGSDAGGVQQRGCHGTSIATTTGTTTQQEQQKKDKPEWLKELSSRITLSGYAQAGWSYQNPNNKATNAYNLKRTLLWAKARITDRWSFLFMHDFSSVVQEFYTDYRLSKNNELTVRLGQFKTAFSMENPLSPTQLELIDVYSQAVLYLAGEGPDPLNGVNYGRDMGLEIYGDLFKNVLHYELALMSGQGINRKDLNNQKDFIAKLEVRPIDGLRFVASGYLGTGCAVNTAAWNPDIKVGDNYKRNRYSIGAEYKTAPYTGSKYKEARPASIRAEWLGGKDGDVCSRGGYATVCIPVVNALDVVASGETFDRNTKVDGIRPTSPSVCSTGTIRSAVCNCNTPVASVAIRSVKTIMTGFRPKSRSHFNNLATDNRTKRTGLKKSLKSCSPLPEK